uniref:Uncharacterized protein n=1 Tax=Mycena chlorophos TaxID=658473 RepID=A0ABQ0LNY8_MYCCL|nr:predicted protein [Mycena chlorophos]
MVSPSTSTATSVASIPEEYDATPSTGNIPIPLSPDPSGPGFMQEIDGWIENIGRLVHALEEQHQQRQFGLTVPVKEPAVNGMVSGSAPSRPPRRISRG